MAGPKFAYEGLNKVIHERARLGILTSLVTHKDGLSFVELKKLCDLTDGNLSRHIKVLSEAGFVSVEKSFQDNRPHTFCQITGTGQNAFSAYLQVLESIVKDAAPAGALAKSGPKTKRAKSKPKPKTA